MFKTFAAFAGLVLFASLCGSARAADSKVDAEGFVRDWLMAAPFSIAEDSAAEEIDKAQIAKEGEIQPKAGDKVKIGDKEQAWKAVTAKEYNLDFNQVLGKANEDVLGYLVAYVVADKEMAGLTLGIGSNDQAKVYLNGEYVGTWPYGYNAFRLELTKLVKKTSEAVRIQIRAKRDETVKRGEAKRPIAEAAALGEQIAEQLK